MNPEIKVVFEIDFQIFNLKTMYFKKTKMYFKEFK